MVVRYIRPKVVRYLFLVFMWRHHFPKPKNINLCEVLVLSDVRTSKTFTFCNVWARQGSSLCDRVRLNFQVCALRCVTSKWQTVTYGLEYPKQSSPRVTPAEVTFSLFLSKIQPTVYIKIANPSRGTRLGSNDREKLRERGISAHLIIPWCPIIIIVRFAPGRFPHSKSFRPYSTVNSCFQCFLQARFGKLAW